MLKQVILAVLFLGIAVHAKVSQQEITALITSLKTAVELDNRCETASTCATAAVGARACGGPSSYVVYSTKSSNADHIRSLAQLSTTIEQQYNMENSMISICSMAMPPRVACNANKCVASASFGTFQPGDI